MLGNIALDVVIGLMFVFLLYSLFASVLAEIFATAVGLRARNLKEGVDRMLNDETDWREDAYRKYGNLSSLPEWLRRVARHWFRFLFFVADRIYRLIDSLRLLKNPDNELINKFYDHPEIKYLGSTGVFQNPSSFKSISFSKTLMYLLNGDGPVVAANIDRALRTRSPQIVGTETAKYVISLWEDSQGDVSKFKLQLEAWFDRTMEQCTEWYKRKIQVILLIIGFGMAWFFNADTFTIVRKLSNDRDAREKMVALASSYLENNPAPPSIFSGAPRPGEANGETDSASAAMSTTMQKQWDSILEVKKQLEGDIRDANTILGSGGWLPDTIVVLARGVYHPPIVEAALPEKKKEILEGARSGQHVPFAFRDKVGYLWKLGGHHFFGFLVMAIAVSLGAPFWFDLLNKIMRLRTSAKVSV